jgi:hypothetical protein
LLSRDKLHHISAECFLGRGSSDSDYGVDIQLTREERSMSRRVAVVDVPFDGVWRIRRLSDVNGVEVRTLNGGRIPVERDWLVIPDSWGDVHVGVVTPRSVFDFRVSPGLAERGWVTIAPADDLRTVTPRGICIRRSPKHLLTCVALCQPKLVDPHDDRVPSATEVLATLVAAGVDEGSRRPERVQRRLEEVSTWLDVEPRTNRALRDRLVQSRAVTFEHLRLLSNAE